MPIWRLRAPHDRSIPSLTAEGFRRPRCVAAHAGRSVAIYLALGPRRPEAARDAGDAAALLRQTRHHRGAVHLQMGGRRAQRPHESAARRAAVDCLRVRGAGADDGRVWRHAHRHGAADAGARRYLRQGGDARGAPARVPHLRAHAHALAALPSRAQDRRADAGARARPQRDRDHRPDGDPAASADDRGACADHRRADVGVRLALRAGDRHHGRALHGVHLLRDRVAHQHSPHDERQRHRRQHQGDRTRCSTTKP